MCSLDDSDTHGTPAQEPAEQAGSDAPKPGEIIVYKGRPARVCKNLALRDEETGKLVRGVGWNSKTGSAAAHKRHQAARRATREALVQQARERGLQVNNSAEAFGVMAGTLAGDVMDKQGKLSDRVMATRSLGRWSDILPDPKARVDDNTAAEISLRMTPEAWAKAVELLGKR